MSDFSEAFSDAFDAALTVFGGTGGCVIKGQAFDCVLHGFESRETIKGGTSAARQKEAGGTIYLKNADWETAKALLIAGGRPTAKGAHVTVAGDTFRVLNTPEVGYESDTVELQLGPLTT